MRNLLFFVLLFAINFKNIAQDNLNFIHVEKKNWVSVKDSIELLKNSIFAFSDFEEQSQENKNLSDTIISYDLKLNLYLIDLVNISELKIQSKEITNNIVINISYQLNKSLFNQYLPPGFKSLEIKKPTLGYIYVIHRDENQHACTTEEKRNLFRFTLYSCIKIISKSEKTAEYLTYKSQELIQVNDLSNRKLDLLNNRIDSLEELMTEQHQKANLKNNPKNIISIDYSNSIHGWGNLKNNYLFDKINVSSIGINWLFFASEKIYMGIGLSHFKNQFNSSFKYDSVNYSSQTDIGIPFIKSIITRDLSELNTFTGNSLLINFRFSNNLNENIHVDMNMNLSYSPKFNITSKVSSGTTDYVGYLTSVNEPLSNLADLGLKSAVSMVNLEDQNYYSSFGIILQPTIGYETQKFYSRIGFSFSLMQYMQISNMELSTTSRIGDYNSSISQIGNFNLNTLNLSLTVGIRL